MSRITILAGGHSASQFDLRKLPGTIIAVNDAAYHAPRWDLCVSMDRLWTENRAPWIARQKSPVWLRRTAAGRYPWTHLQDNVTLFDCEHESTTLSDEPGRLNGTHSGFCAINLAYHMRPLELYLVGLDCALGPRGEKHWYPDYAWSRSTGQARLTEWAGQFDTAARQFREVGTSVFLCGTHSQVQSFRHLDREGLERVCAAA